MRPSRSLVQGFRREIFADFLWKRRSQRTERALDLDFAESAFSRNATLLGVFYAVHGADDVGPVRLGSIGWSGMVENLVSITVVFEEEDKGTSEANRPR